MRTRATAGVRAVAGAGLLLRPDLAARLLGSPPTGAHPVLRGLGVRHLVEAATLWTRPTRTATDVAVAIDAVHVGSLLGFAAISAEHRRPALRDAALATGLLLATLHARPDS